MKIEVEKGEKNKVTLVVDVASEDISRGMEAAYAKVAKKVNIPGFRKGKAPKKVLNSYLGEGAIIDQMIKEVVPEAYEKAVEESKIFPIDLPKIEVKEASTDKLTFSAEVEVKPEVILGDYKKITIKKAEVKVTDEEVKAQIESVRNRMATLNVAPDRPVQEGDFVIIDFEGLLEGKEFEGSSGVDSMIEIGGQMLLPDFDKKLIGANRGDEVKFDIEVPADFEASDIAGKRIDFTVKIKEIKLKVLPELNDEFADKAGGAKDMAEHEADTRKRLVEIKEAKCDDDFRRDLLAKLTEGAKVDIPAIMIERRLDEMVNQFLVGMKSRGIGDKEYFEATGSNPDSLRKSFKERAAETVKEALALEALAKKENIEVLAEEIDREIGELAESIGRDKDGLKDTLVERGALSDIEDDIMMKKAMDRLIEIAQGKSTKKTTKEEE